MIWLLEIKAAGGPLRYASAPVVVDGVTFAAGLSPFELTRDETLSEIGVEITDQSETWRPESGEPARLELFDPSTGRVLPILEGLTADPEYANPGQPHTLSVSIRAAVQATVLYPPASASVSPATWAGPAELVDPDSVGVNVAGFDEMITNAAYPTIIGYPGAGERNTTTPGLSAPCLPVGIAIGDHVLLLSLGKIEATTVKVFDLDDTFKVRAEDHLGNPVYDADGSEFFAPGPVMLYQDIAVTQTTDLLGQTVSVAVVPTASSPWKEFLGGQLGHRYACGYTSASGYGGGVIEGGQVLRGLGDVIMWALTKGGVRVDTARQRAHLADLNTSKIDTVLNTPASDLPQMVDSQFAGTFNLLRVQTASGLYYRRKVANPQAIQAVRHLSVERRDIDRRASVREAMRSVATSFSLEYGWMPFSNRYMYSLRAEGAAGVGVNVVVPELAKSVGTEAKPITTMLTWDRNTAARMLGDLALLIGRMWLRTTYEGDELIDLEPGDIVTITDPEAGLNMRPVAITAVTLGGPRVSIDVSWPK